MPDQHSPSLRRRQQLGMAATLWAWLRSWAPHRPCRVSRSRRAVSLVLSALLVLATGLVAGLATLAPATASAGLPDVAIHAATAPMTNAANSAIKVTATCPAGSTLVGGGAFLRKIPPDTTAPGNGLKLNGSISADASGNPLTDNASTPSSWTAVAGFGGQSDTNDQATAFANCATGGPTTTVVKVSAPVGPSTQGNPPKTTTATCPSGTRLISGGAVGVPPTEGSFKPIASYPSDTGRSRRGRCYQPELLDCLRLRRGERCGRAGHRFRCLLHGRHHYRASGSR